MATFWTAEKGAGLGGLKMLMASQNLDVTIPPSSTVIVRVESSTPSFAQISASLVASKPIHFVVFHPHEYAKYPRGEAHKAWPDRTSLQATETLLGSNRWVFAMSNANTTPVHVAGSFSYGPASR